MTATGPPRGVTVAQVRRLLRAVPGIEEGTSYGLPAFKLGGKFFARFRDDDTVPPPALTDVLAESQRAVREKRIRRPGPKRRRT